MAYLPKLNPTVGGGLGGLPERSVDGGGATSLSHPLSAPILNSVANIGNAISANPEIIDLTFTPNDASTVCFQVCTGSVIASSAVASTMLFFPSSGTYYANINAIGTSTTSHITYDHANDQLKLLDGSGISAVASYNFIEFDMKVKNSALLTYSGGTSGSLPFTITNHRNVYAIPLGVSASDLGASIGGFCYGYSASVPLCYLGDEVMSYFYLTGEDSYSMVNGGSSSYRIYIVEFE